MNAARNGQFTFQYTNLQRIANLNGADFMNGPLNEQQGILELAWLMGTGNAVDNVLPEFQEFDGTDTTVNPPPDIFFVVHLHIDHVIYDEDENPYLGIYAMVGFVSKYICYHKTCVLN